MMICSALLSAALAMSQPVTSALQPDYSHEEIRVLAVPPTPFSATVLMAIAIPKAGARVKGNTTWIQLRVEGYALGADSQFVRREEVSNSNMGQTVHIVIDDHPYFAINGPSLDPFDEEGYFYDSVYKFKVPFKLEEGVHTIRVFPARSFGESLKGGLTFHSSFFYLGNSNRNWGIDLQKPYLTYNEPSDQLYLQEGMPVLLDFYLSNCELTPDGYRVRLSVDGTTERILTSWQPYYIYGMGRGEHTIRLELIDKSGAKVPGSSNETTRKITVHSSL